MMRPNITEENFLEMIGDYARWRYGDTVWDYYDECPYDLDLVNDDLVYKQILTWLSYEKMDSSGNTLVDEFVEKFVDDKKLKRKILQIKNLTYDAFTIRRAADVNKRMVAMAESDGRMFEIEIIGNQPESYTKDSVFIGRIYPWHSDGTYRITGITTILPKDMLNKYNITGAGISNEIIQKSKRDLQSIKSITIPDTPTTKALFKKLPAEWVDEICDSLHIGKRATMNDKIKRITSVLTSADSLTHIISDLAEDERATLKYVLKEDGCVMYEDLCAKKEICDIKLSRDEKSVTNDLMQYGLLVVGNKKINNRTCKVAVIPTDITAHLKLFL